MSFLLALIPDRYRLIAEILLTLALIGGVWGWIEYGKHEAREGGLKDGRAEVQAKWDHARAAQQDQALAESEANAKETQRRLARQKEAQDANDTELAQARADADRATTAVDGLRQRAAQYAAAARRAGSNPATGGNSTPATDPAGMLSDVLGKVADRSRLLAAYADAARRAGQQCSRDYDALSATKGQP